MRVLTIETAEAIAKQSARGAIKRPFEGAVEAEQGTVRLRVSVRPKHRSPAYPEEISESVVLAVSSNRTTREFDGECRWWWRVLAQRLRQHAKVNRTLSHV